eukprot:gene9918-biopygen21275
MARAWRGLVLSPAGGRHVRSSLRLALHLAVLDCTPDRQVHSTTRLSMHDAHQLGLANGLTSDNCPFASRFARCKHTANEVVWHACRLPCALHLAINGPEWTMGGHSQPLLARANRVATLARANRVNCIESVAQRGRCAPPPPNAPESA